MIVEPGFFDHWKTKLLVRLSGDPASPLWVQRLWAHCQLRKRWVFNGANFEWLPVVCCVEREAGEIADLLLRCGFIEVDAKKAKIIVHDFQLTNRYLVSCWKNGSKGGRPRRTDSKPMGSMGETHGEPIASKPAQSNLIISSTEGSTRGEKKVAYPHGITDSEWIATLKADKTYQGIDIDREHGKMMAWCNTNEKNPSRRRFINWLNRAEKPMTGAEPSDQGEGYWVKPVWNTK